MNKFDLSKLAIPKNKFALLNSLNHIQSEFMRFKILDKIFQVVIPFNRGLGFEIKKLDKESCQINSLDKKRRQNHVGGAHACALAVLGEYTAGLLLSQHCNPEKYRIIISHLEVEYHKQGKGVLKATCLKPDFTILNPVPHDNANSDQKITAQKEVFVDLVTEIKNSKDELVCIVKTKWQAKPWDLVRK